MYFYKIGQELNYKFDSIMFIPHGKFYELLSSTPTAILAFTFQFNVFPIYYSLKDQTPESMMKATYIGVFFCAAIYIIVGIIAYLSYGDTMAGSVLNSLLADLSTYNGKDNFLIVLLILVAISFLVSSTMSIPLMFIGLKKNFINTVIFCKKKYFIKNQGLIEDTKRYEDEINRNLLDGEEIPNIIISNNTNHINNSNNNETNANDRRSVNNVRKLTEMGSFSKKTHKQLAEKIESKYITPTEKVVITIILFVLIVAMTILIKLLKTVSINSFNNPFFNLFLF